MKNRVLNNKQELEGIIGKCQVCYVGMVDKENKPYVIPMNFGYKDGVILMHGAQKGKKVDILRNNPSVCIVFSTDHQLRYVTEDVACSWSMRYRSVLAYGTVEFIDDLDEKIIALNTFMSNYTPKKFNYNTPALREVNVFKVVVEKFEGRAYGY